MRSTSCVPDVAPAQTAAASAVVALDEHPRQRLDALGHRGREAVQRRRRAEDRLERLGVVARRWCGRRASPPSRSRSTSGEVNAFSIGICWSSSMPISRASGSRSSSSFAASVVARNMSRSHHTALPLCTGHKCRWRFRPNRTWLADRLAGLTLIRSHCDMPADRADAGPPAPRPDDRRRCAPTVRPHGGARAVPPNRARIAVSFAGSGRVRGLRWRVRAPAPDWRVRVPRTMMSAAPHGRQPADADVGERAWSEDRRQRTRSTSWSRRSRSSWPPGGRPSSPTSSTSPASRCTTGPRRRPGAVAGREHRREHRPADPGPARGGRSARGRGAAGSGAVRRAAGALTGAGAGAATGLPLRAGDVHPALPGRRRAPRRRDPVVSPGSTWCARSSTASPPSSTTCARRSARRTRPRPHRSRSPPAGSGNGC